MTAILVFQGNKCVTIKLIQFNLHEMTYDPVLRNTELLQYIYCSQLYNKAALKITSF